MASSHQQNITVLGSTAVGKSSLTVRFITNAFKAEYTPTISSTLRHQISRHNANFNLTINDTAGLEEHSLILTKYIDESEGFLLVYSVADKRSFETIQDIYFKLTNAMNGRKVPIVVIGNKTDLESRRVISFEEGKRIAEEWKAEFLETSAKVGDRVNEIFMTLVDRIHQAKNHGSRPDPVPISQHSNNNKCTIS